MNVTQASEMSRAQVLTLMACMLSTAHVDGLQPQELELMKQFYEASGHGDLPAFSDEQSTYGDPMALAAQSAGDSAFAQQLVLMCYMTGYADGHLSPTERAHVQAIAKQAGLSEEGSAALLQQVKDSLIGAIAMLPDAESVASIAKSL